VVIPDSVYAVLTDRRTRIQGDRIHIPFHVDEATWRMLAYLLRSVGGRWGGPRSGAWVWPHDIEWLMARVLATGAIPSNNMVGWFPSPPGLVRRILDAAGMGQGARGLTVLEPSAGAGDLAAAAAGTGAVVDCVELDPRRAELVREAGFARRVECTAFETVDPLAWCERGYDRVLMVPPFWWALEHVQHALGFLGDGGVLVAVVPDHLRRVERSAWLRRLVQDCGGSFTALPEDTLRRAGLRDRVALVVLPAPAGGPVRNHSWLRRQPLQESLFGE